MGARGAAPATRQGGVLFGLILLALLAGYRRGRSDAVVTRLFDLLWSFPALLLGVLLSTALSARRRRRPDSDRVGVRLIPIVVIGLVYVPYVARPLRGQVLVLPAQPLWARPGRRACGRWP